MKKLLAVFLLPLLIISCGAAETEMNIDEVFNTLTIKDGTIAGLTIGENWLDAEKTMSELHGDMFDAQNVSGFYESFDHDYGNEGRRYYFECDLTENNFSVILVHINDILKNKSKINDLHQKLVDHFTNLYPEGIAREKDKYSEHTTWLIPESKSTISITAPHLIGTAPGATKCWAFTVEMR